MKLDELERLYSEATQGPWTQGMIYGETPCIEGKEGEFICGLESDQSDADAALIAAMHAALPLLLRVAKAAQENEAASLVTGEGQAFLDSLALYIRKDTDLTAALAALAAWEAG